MPLNFLRRNSKATITEKPRDAKPGLESLEERLVPASVSELTATVQEQRMVLQTKESVVGQVQTSLSGHIAAANEQRLQANTLRNTAQTTDKSLADAVTTKSAQQTLVNGLTATLNQLTADKGAQNQAAVKIQNDLQTLNATLATQTAQSKDARTTLADIEKKLADLQAQLVTQNIAVAQGEKDVVARQADIQTADTALKNAFVSEKSSNATLTAARATAAAAQTRFQTTTTLYTQAVGTLNSAIVTRDSLQRQFGHRPTPAQKILLSAANATVTLRTTQMQQAKTTLDASRVTMDAANVLVQKAGAAVGAASLQIQQADKAKVTAMHLLNTTINSLNLTRAARDATIPKIAPLQTQVNQLKANPAIKGLEETQAAIAAKNTALQNALTIINTLTTQINGVKVQLDSATVALTVATNLVTQQTATSAAVHATLDTVFRQMTETEKTIARERNDLAVAEAQLKEWTIQVATTDAALSALIKTEEERLRTQVIRVIGPSTPTIVETTDTLSTLRAQLTAKEKERTDLQNDHRAIAADTTISGAIKNGLLEAKNDQIIAKSKEIEALMTKVAETEAGAKNGITDLRRIDLPRVDLPPAKTLPVMPEQPTPVVAPPVQPIITVPTTPSINPDWQKIVDDAAANAQQAEEARLQEELRRLLAPAPAPVITEHVEVTYAALQVGLRRVGVDAYALDVSHLPAGARVAVWRHERSATSSYDGFSEIGTGLKDGTGYFQTQGDSSALWPEKTLFIHLIDNKTEKILASRELSNLRDLMTADWAVTMNEIQTEVRTVVRSAAEAVPTTPTMRVTLEGGIVKIHAEGMPSRVTVIVKDGKSELRDIVIAPGSSDIALQRITPLSVIEGKCTIQLVMNGVPLGEPQTLTPDVTLPMTGIARSTDTVNLNETITAAPVMQMIFTPQNSIIRYQFVEPGSMLEVMNMQTEATDRIVLSGSQGTLQQKGKFAEGKYRLMLLGPTGQSLNIMQYANIASDGTNWAPGSPAQSPTVKKTIPLAMTSPMIWIGQFDNISTSGGANHNWSNDMGQKVLNMTGLQTTPGQALGALETLIKIHCIGMDPAQLPSVPDAFRTAIMAHFSELCSLATSVYASQNEWFAQSAAAERAAWAAHDAKLAESTTMTGAVSDEAFNHNLGVIVTAHAGNIKEAAKLVKSYMISVQRTMDDVIAKLGANSVVVAEMNKIMIAYGGTENGMQNDMNLLPPSAIQAPKTQTEMGTLGEICLPAFPTYLERDKTYTYRFTIKTPMIWQGSVSVGRLQQGEVTLQLENGTVLAHTFPTNVSIAVDAGAIHQTLAPGTYILKLTSKTNIGTGMTDFTTQMNLVATTLSSVVGTVEMGGRQMPVKLSRFGKDKDGNALNIDKNLTTWIVIHGRSDNDGGNYPGVIPSDSMKLLTQSMFDFAKNKGQVITLDWHDAAADNRLLGQLQDATWTMNIGEWAAHQISALKIDPSHINFVAHSHGTYIAFFAAQKFIQEGKGVTHSIIALDPAANVGFANGNAVIDSSAIKFSTVTETSVAIKATANKALAIPIGDHPSIFFQQPLIDDISEYGSDTRAVTAHHAYNLVVPNQSDKGIVHNFPITAFSIMLSDVTSGNVTGLTNSPINPNVLLNLHEGCTDKIGEYEGAIFATIGKSRHNDGSDWLQAVPLEIDMATGKVLSLPARLLNP